MKRLSLNNVAALYYTPILTRVHEDTILLNKTLTEQIIELSKKDAGVENSNRGGWHSNLDLLNHLDSNSKNHFLAIIAASIKEMLTNLEVHIEEDKSNLSISAWANIAEQGNYSVLHSHPGSVWSGVYYVADGGDSNCRIVFPDLRIAAQMIKSPINPFTEDTLEIAPVSGLVVLFPSWLPHSVKPYTGNSKRISIAFNVTA